jgi:hypothetical protein
MDAARATALLPISLPLAAMPGSVEPCKWQGFHKEITKRHAARRGDHL